MFVLLLWHDMTYTMSIVPMKKNAMQPEQWEHKNIFKSSQIHVIEPGGLCA